MVITRLPFPLREHARRLHDETVDVCAVATWQPAPAELESPATPVSPVAVPSSDEFSDEIQDEAGTWMQWQSPEAAALSHFRLGPQGGKPSPTEEMLAHYLILSRAETDNAALVSFATAAEQLAQAVTAALPRVTRSEIEAAAGRPASLAGVRRWLAAYGRFWVVWQAWLRRAELMEVHPKAEGSAQQDQAPVCLSREQRAAVEHLVALIRGRENGSMIAGLPGCLRPRRWSHPLLVGPAGVGKAFVVSEVGRRLGRAVLRVEIASWIVVANRSGRATLETVEDFLAKHPDGVIYLSGVDALAGTRLGQSGDTNLSWWSSVLGEIESSMDWIGATRYLSSTTRKPAETRYPLMIVGGRFSTFWGQTDLGGPAGAEAWRLADAKPLADPAMVADWLDREGWLPAGVRSRLVTRPLVISPVGQEEAWEISRQMCAALPSNLDGLFEAGPMAEALARPEGWQRLAALIESRLANWLAIQ